MFDGYCGVLRVAGRLGGSGIGRCEVRFFYGVRSRVRLGFRGVNMYF